MRGVCALPLSQYLQLHTPQTVVALSTTRFYSFVYLFSSFAGWVNHTVISLLADSLASKHCVSNTGAKPTPQLHHTHTHRARNRPKCNRVRNSSMRRLPGTTENKIHIMKFNFHISQAHTHAHTSIASKRPHSYTHTHTHTHARRHDTRVREHWIYLVRHIKRTTRFIERETVVGLDDSQIHCERSYYVHWPPQLIRHNEPRKRAHQR